MELTKKVTLKMYYCGGKRRGENFGVHLNYVLVHLNEKVRRTRATNVKSKSAALSDAMLI